MDMSDKPSGADVSEDLLWNTTCGNVVVKVEAGKERGTGKTLGS
jgi:hypothetical protein